MLPQEFVSKWRGNTSTERQVYQQHFLDLCALVGHGTPAALDPENKFFTFEAGAAKDLVEQRDAWLHPPGLPEAKLKEHTLTKLYNARPAWLDAAHKRLDAAVFDAYGWPHDLTDEEILARLLALNLERAAQQA